MSVQFVFGVILWPKCVYLGFQEVFQEPTSEQDNQHLYCRSGLRGFSSQTQTLRPQYLRLMAVGEVVIKPLLAFLVAMAHNTENSAQDTCYIFSLPAKYCLRTEEHCSEHFQGPSKLYILMFKLFSEIRVTGISFDFWCTGTLVNRILNTSLASRKSVCQLQNAVVFISVGRNLFFL